MLTLMFLKTSFISFVAPPLPCNYYWRNGIHWQS